MKKLYLSTLFALSVAAVTVGSAVGQSGSGDGPDGGSGRGDFRARMMRMMPVLAALDADGDGVISKAEIKNAAAALRTLDKDKDGKLSKEEMQPDFSGMFGGGGSGGHSRGSHRDQGNHSDQGSNSDRPQRPAIEE